MRTSENAGGPAIGLQQGLRYVAAGLVLGAVAASFESRKSRLSKKSHHRSADSFEHDPAALLRASGPAQSGEFGGPGGFSRSFRPGSRDSVEQNSWDSFPASDAPSW